MSLFPHDASKELAQNCLSGSACYAQPPTHDRPTQIPCFTSLFHPRIRKCSFRFPPDHLTGQNPLPFLAVCLSGDDGTTQYGLRRQDLLPRRSPLLPRHTSLNLRRRRTRPAARTIRPPWGLGFRHIRQGTNHEVASFFLGVCMRLRVRISICHRPCGHALACLRWRSGYIPMPCLHWVRCRLGASMFHADLLLIAHLHDMNVP